jgi:hypothetical protein
VLKMAQVSAAALEVKALSECFMERLFLSLIVLRQKKLLWRWSVWHWMRAYRWPWLRRVQVGRGWRCDVELTSGALR